MTHLVILPDSSWAGHCTSGKSNKVWAACLAYEQEEEKLAPPTSLSETTPVLFLSVHGPYGAALQQTKPQQLSLKAAQIVFRAKRQEKAGKGYASVTFSSFLSAFGSPLAKPLVLPPAAGGTATMPPLPAQEKAEESSPSWRHTAALLKAISYEEMMTLVSDERDGEPSYGVSEKANGERCLVEFDGQTLRAYNRKGRLTSAPPEGAQALCRLGHPFVIDGERLIRNQAGCFVVFDVLEWDGVSQLAVPYRTRLTRLVRAMQRVGLLKHTRLTPTLRQAHENSAVSELCVLLAVRGAEQALTVVEEIQAAGGEGVVLRHLSALYPEGGFKYKFLEDIDAFVIGIVPGVSAGSLKLGMRRPADGAIIEVGHVRSGLTDPDVEAVRRLLTQGHAPVFTISYLPASTISINLVQPKTSMALLRTDKDERECTTDQFGPEKADVIAQARPVSGLVLR